MTEWTVYALCAGKAVPFKGAEKSAFPKLPVSGPIAISFEGLEGDEQADRKHHGGPDMALHLYPADHHAFWHNQIGAHDLLQTPGAFGTNLAVSNINEDQIHIGDQFRLGTALIEVSQTRKPCWKIEHRFGHKDMVSAIITSGRSGWYFRVLEEGSAAAGDALERVAMGHEEWPVRRVFSALFGPKSEARFSPQDFKTLASLEKLSADHRSRAQARLS